MYILIVDAAILSSTTEPSVQTRCAKKFIKAEKNLDRTFILYVGTRADASWAVILFYPQRERRRRKEEEKKWETGAWG